MNPDLISDQNLIAEDLISAVRFAASKGWSPATGGNYSARISDSSFLITASGLDKSMITARDLLLVDPDGNIIPGQSGKGHPSAETLLHAQIYQIFPEAGCVLHTHSIPATIVSSLYESLGKDNVGWSGYEMQKSIKGYTTHEEHMSLMICRNKQDMRALCADLELRLKEQKTPAYLLSGHGMYVWGSNVSDARRHMEGLEFLLECHLRKIQMQQVLSGQDPVFDL